ncbi:MAG: MarR family winged helix-turn-helix transcriptional regulator [Geminicoccaceae bacterium]
MRPAVEVHKESADTESKQRLRLWIRLLRASRDLEGELRERLRREIGTTLPRFDVLSALDRAMAPMTMTELSRYLMVSNGNVTGIIERLVDDGLVIRVQKKGDRRASMVALTAAGEKAFADMAKEHESWVNELLAPINGEDAADMIDILTRFDRCRRASLS